MIEFDMINSAIPLLISIKQHMVVGPDTEVNDSKFWALSTSLLGEAKELSIAWV